MKCHSFQWHMVLIIISGKMKFFDNANEHVLEAGEVWVGPVGKPHDYWAIGKSSFISAALFVEESFYHLEKNAPKN